MMTEKETIDSVTDDVAQVAIALATGNPAKAFRVLDGNGDGVLSWGELRNKRWTFVVLMLCLLSGLAGYLADKTYIVTDHFRAVILITVAFGLGVFYAALFLPFHVRLFTEDGGSDED